MGNGVGCALLRHRFRSRDPHPPPQESPMPLHPVATRYRPLAWLLAIFLAASTLTRLVLLVAAGSGVPARPGYWLDVFGIGFAYDLLAFVYFAWPLVLLLWL